MKTNIKFTRRFLLLVLLIFFTLPALGQKKWREIDLRVNDIGSGTSYSTVIKKLGKPRRRGTEKFDASSACSGSAETHLTLFYSGLEVILLGDGRKGSLDVYSIEVTSKKWIASGISIGANVKNVLNRFGEPSSKEEKSGETILYYVTKANLGVVNFHFRSNKLIKVLMSETLC